MQRESPAGADIGLGIALILLALVIIFGTLELPEGSFEPLGSASIPQYVSGAIIVLSIWIIARAVVRMRGANRSGAVSSRADREDESFAYPLRPGLAVALMSLAAIYVGLMAMEWLRFSVATAAFTCATVGMLTGFQRRFLLAIAGLALVLGIGLEYAFTQIFVIDLP